MNGNGDCVVTYIASTSVTQKQYVMTMVSPRAPLRMMVTTIIRGTVREACFTSSARSAAHVSLCRKDHTATYRHLRTEESMPPRDPVAVNVPTRQAPPIVDQPPKFAEFAKDLCSAVLGRENP